LFGWRRQLSEAAAAHPQEVRCMPAVVEGGSRCANAAHVASAAVLEQINRADFRPAAGAKPFLD